MSSLPDGPMIELNPKRICCPAHGEHLRAQWPKGAAIVMVMLARAALGSDELADACRRPGDEADAKMPVERINEVLETRPLCYFVDRATIRQALLDAEILRIIRCQSCGRTGMGGPYTISLPTGSREVAICVECALSNGEQTHRLHPDGNVWPQEDA